MVLFNAYTMIIIYNNFKLYFEQSRIKKFKTEEEEPLLEKK